MPDPFSWALAAPYLAIAFIFAYLLGSIPFGLVLVKISGGGDIRNIGSGNIGATNVLRTGSKKLAILTLAFDLLKGTFAVLVGIQWGMDTALTAGYGAILGHMFPIWLAFRGGKGVATALGVILGFSWILALVTALIWLATAFTFRISSLSALIATAAAPVAAWFITYDMQIVTFSAIIAVLIWWKHSSNIARLLKDEEPRIKLGKSADK